MNLQDRVLQQLLKVPRGKVTTYRDLAHAVNTRAYRAVGQALKNNSHPIEVPCHRVIKSTGEVGGYAGYSTSDKKARLLKKEGVTITNGRIDLDRFGYRF